MTNVLATRPVALAIALLFLVGCKRLGAGCGRHAEVVPATALHLDAGEMAVDAGPAPSGDLRGETFFLTLAVYHFAAAPPAAQTEMRKLLTAAGMTIASTPPTEPPKKTTAVILTPPLSEFAPPSLDSLRYRGKTLSTQEKEALQSVVGATVLLVAGPAANAAAAYRTALRACLALERAAPGIFFDDDTREALSRAGWTARLDDWTGDVVPISRHIVIDAYQDGELLRLVTLGMRKFALPDISVTDVPKNASDGMSELMNLASQTLLEHSALPRTGELDVAIAGITNETARRHFERAKVGGSGAGVLHFAIAERQQGDAENRLLALVFAGPVATLQERQAQAIAQVLGIKDKVVGTQHDDALLEASKRARTKALVYKATFAKGPPQLEQLFVKGPFKNRDGDTEWMWIEVTRWSGERIEGILEGEPVGDIGLKTGARVSVSETSIFDYIYRHADGGVEGNETAALLKGTVLR